MKKYKIYLTKSNDVAHMLYEAWNAKIGQEDVLRVSSAMVNKDCRIPEIYHGTKYYFCLVEMGSDEPGYEIIFA